MANISAARELATRARFPEDKKNTAPQSYELTNREQHRNSMLRHGVLISESVTPLLESRLNTVCQRLLIPRIHVSAFVYSCADIQSDCLIDSPDTCVLRFTSGLINLMNEGEFQFVAAHELGHFLLGHGACSQHSGEMTSEDFMVKRARELSADRIGFLGVDNLDVSIQAIMKSASGLGEQFLRFDVSSFLSQSSKISKPSRGESINSTHPSLLIRCRSLLWFSMAVKSIDDLFNISASTINEIDVKITKDLEKFVDGQVRFRKIEIENDIVLWKSCLLIYHMGAFKKDIQDRLSDELGNENLQGLKSFFDTYSSEDLLNEMNKRLEFFVSSIYQEFPSSAKEIENKAFSRAYKIAEG